MPALFDPLTLRGITFPNRIGMSPMCQYSSVDGLAQPWHHTHLVSRAVGGVGLIMAEATAVTPEGRITPHDAGLWSDDHIAPLRVINQQIRHYGAVAGVQLAHAGRKASTLRPWDGNGVVPVGQGGWQTIAPSPIAFGGALTHIPREMTTADIQAVTAAFAQSAIRADQADYDVIELHAAHGYLLHSFLSPLTNQRTDAYGGSFLGRSRLMIEVTQAVRRVWPSHKPLFVRLSCTDWVEGGWTLADSIMLAQHLKPAGVDLIDCSSGGAIPNVSIPTVPHYQVGFAEAIRAQAHIATAAVGLITTAQQAEVIVQSEQADLVLLGRELLRQPYWPLHAAHELKANARRVPAPYERAF